MHHVLSQVCHDRLANMQRSHQNRCRLTNAHVMLTDACVTPMDYPGVPLLPIRDNIIRRIVLQVSTSYLLLRHVQQCPSICSCAPWRPQMSKPVPQRQSMQYNGMFSNSYPGSFGRQSVFHERNCPSDHVQFLLCALFRVVAHFIAFIIRVPCTTYLQGQMWHQDNHGWPLNAYVFCVLGQEGRHFNIRERHQHLCLG